MEVEAVDIALAATGLVAVREEALEDLRVDQGDLGDVERLAARLVQGVGEDDLLPGNQVLALLQPLLEVVGGNKL